MTDGDDVVPVPRLLPMERYLDYLANRVLPDPTLRPMLEGLWSASAVPGGTAMSERLAGVLASVNLSGDLEALAGGALSACAACGVDFPQVLDDLAKKAFMIVVLVPRGERDFAPDSVGALTRPVELAAWERRVRSRFGFLADLDQDERRWAACDPRQRDEIQVALSNRGFSPPQEN